MAGGQLVEVEAGVLGPEMPVHGGDEVVVGGAEAVGRGVVAQDAGDARQAFQVEGAVAGQVDRRHGEDLPLGVPLGFVPQGQVVLARLPCGALMTAGVRLPRRDLAGSRNQVRVRAP